MKTRKLLLIDDSEAFGKSIVSAGKDCGWTVYVSVNLNEIAEWLADHSPDVVLLDWQVPGHSREQYARLLSKKGLANRTLLLSAGVNDTREAFVKTHGLAGSRPKPFDTDRFEDEIRLPQSPIASPWPGLEAMADTLEVAIDILDRNLNTRWSNDRAENEKRTIAQNLIVKWLRVEIEDNKQLAARRLDWDGGEGRFLESRLFQLKSGDYWLARDWWSTEKRPHDHELLNLERSRNRTEWLRGVAILLAQRYAISRFRVYKIAVLPHSVGLEQQHSPLIFPLFQSGGGIEPDEKGWLRTGFLVASNPNTTRALKEDYSPQPDLISVDEQTDSCGAIRSGPINTKRVQFPIRDNEGEAVALFALDRRLDHADNLTGFDQKVVHLAKRMASDELGPLTGGQCSLMKGLVTDIGERLCTWLMSGENRRMTDWHEAISKSFEDTFAEAARSPEMTYVGLSRMCEEVARRWKNEEISGRVMGTTPWRHTNLNEPISAWYIETMIDETRWHAVAGWGTAFLASRHQLGGHELSLPHLTARDMPAWQATVIQNFQDWIKNSPGDPYSHLNDQERSCIGAWLAVPMQVDGAVRALMVVHSPHAHYFTAFRVKLMEKAAKRLLPLVAAARRESRARSAFTAAVMHEVKGDSQAAAQVMDMIQSQAVQTNWATPLADFRSHLVEVRHRLESLTALGQDSLDVFQLGRSERIQRQHYDEVYDQNDLECTLGDLIEKAMLGWRTVYENTEVHVQLSEALTARKVRIARSSMFRRVFRILLHNAFIHGEKQVQIDVSLGTNSSHTLGIGLVLKIANLARADVTRRLAQPLNLADQVVGPSALDRGRFGLALAHQLASESAGVLTDLDFEPMADDQTWVRAQITLVWPIHLIDYTPAASHENPNR